MVTDNTLVAVLSGDLIGSSEAGPEATERTLNRLMFALVSHHEHDDPAYFTRFRGDGWQILLKNHRSSLLTALRLFSSLQSSQQNLQTRIAIGVGTMNPLRDDDLSSASGPAFEASGRALDAMKKSDHFTISGDGVTPLHKAIVTLIEEHMTRWTSEQAEAAAYYFHPRKPTLKDIAQDLGISTQAVHSRINGAGARALRQAVEFWQAYEENHP